MRHLGPALKIFLLTLIALRVATAAGDICQPGWMNEKFTHGDLTGLINAAAVWDDGTGESIYAGGVFHIGGQNTNFARWNGQHWIKLNALGAVQSIAVFDNGTGPALYISAPYTSRINGTLVNNIARWDGQTWSGLQGPTGVGFANTGDVAHAMAVYDDGNGPALYIAGQFQTAGGLLVNNIAKWDGTNWSALTTPQGVGVSTGGVSAMTVFDDGSGPALYLGGTFAFAGGTPIPRIAKWNGNTWSQLTDSSGASFIANRVKALEVHNDGTGPALFVGGTNLRLSDGTNFGNIAKWNGATWTALTGQSGTGVNDSVKCLYSHDDGSGTKLFVAGQFTAAGGLPASGIAAWNGSEWSTLSGPQGEGVSGTIPIVSVNKLITFNDGSGPAMFAAGKFEQAGGIQASSLAKWDGAEFAGVTSKTERGLNSSVTSMIVFNEGSEDSLYIAGNFTKSGDFPTRRVARWNGSEWSVLQGPTENGVGPNEAACLKIFDDGSGPALFVGGLFADAGGLPAAGLAKWDGSTWLAVPGLMTPGGANPAVWAMEIFDDGAGPALYVGGDFITANGDVVNGVAKWDGSDWHPLTGPNGTGVLGYIDAMAVYDDGNGPALYLGGNFLSVGGLPASNIAKWDGSNWLPMPGLTHQTQFLANVRTLAVFDDGTGPALYAGGLFQNSGETQLNHIAKWNGTAWTALTTTGGVGVDGNVHAMKIIQDETGSLLLVGGDFQHAGGELVNNIAAWNGSQWSAFESQGGRGVNGVVSAITVFDDGTGPHTYFGGAFTTAGGKPALRIARWGIPCPPTPPCPCDTDNDGQQTITDYFTYLTNFFAQLNGPGSADFDGDGQVTIADYFAFLNCLPAIAASEPCT